MDPHSTPPAPTVTNLVLGWDRATLDGGSFLPDRVGDAVERAVHAPEACDPAGPPPRHSAYDVGVVGDADAIVARSAQPGRILTDVLANPERDDAATSEVPYDELHRRDIARELLRARLVSLAEQHEHRSAYEIVFIMLAAAVAILLAAPPLVQVLLAAHGVQA